MRLKRFKRWLDLINPRYFRVFFLVFFPPSVIMLYHNGCVAFSFAIVRTVPPFAIASTESIHSRVRLGTHCLNFSFLRHVYWTVKEITFFPRRVLHAFEFVKQITELMPTNPTTHIHTHKNGVWEKRVEKPTPIHSHFGCRNEWQRRGQKSKNVTLALSLWREGTSSLRKKPRTRKKSVRFYLREDEKRNANIETMYFVDCK